jgi:hypothetical protein
VYEGELDSRLRKLGAEALPSPPMNERSRRSAATMLLSTRPRFCQLHLSLDIGHVQVCAPIAVGFRSRQRSGRNDRLACVARAQAVPFRLLQPIAVPNQRFRDGVGQEGP